MPELIVQLIAYTVLIIVMIIGLKKASVFIQSRDNFINKDRRMKIIERIILSKDKELLVVEVDGKNYFLAATANNISILKELDSKNYE